MRVLVRELRHWGRRSCCRFATPRECERFSLENCARSSDAAATTGNAVRRNPRGEAARGAAGPRCRRAARLSVGVARPVAASLVAALAALTAEGVLRDLGAPSDPLGWIDALAAALCESVAAARVLRLRELMASASEATGTGRQVEELVRQRKIVPTELQLELLAAALPPDDGAPALAVLVDFPKSAVQLAALERRIGRVTCALFAGDPDAPRADMLSVATSRDR